MNYGNIILIGDFNAEPLDTALFYFCETYDLKNIVKDKTCFKNPSKPSCIDLIIKKKPKSSRISMVIETELSDFLTMCVKVMKVYYGKQKLTIIHYRELMDFNNEACIKDLKALLSKSFHEEMVPFEALRKSVNVTLEKHVPTKTRYS